MFELVGYFLLKLCDVNYFESINKQFNTQGACEPSGGLWTRQENCIFLKTGLQNKSSKHSASCVAGNFPGFKLSSFLYTRISNDLAFS